MGLPTPRRLALLFPLAFAALALGRCSNVNCRTVDAPLVVACVPDAIEAERVVRLEVQELCGRNCARQPVCKATLVSGVVNLEMHAEQCDDVLVNQCAENPCLQRVVGCTLPPLSQGDYTLHGPGLGDQLLRVRHGGAPACQLPRTLPDGGV